MSDKVPPERGLESLEQEVQHWFEALQSKTPDARTRFERLVPNGPATPTLSDVRHALALEHGFSCWTELERKLTASAEEASRSLGQFEEMAQALLEAYRTGTPAAMQRHWAFTWHRRNFEAMRTYVLLDLGRQAGAADQDDISLEDARYLVAREHGFENWDRVVAHYSDMPVEALPLRKPVRLLADYRAGNESTTWSSRDWNSVLARLRERDFAGIDAAGEMTDAMLDDVSHIEQISALNLGGSRRVTDTGVRSLARLSRLRHLDLSGTGVTDQGLEALRALPELETISLAWTNVTDIGVAHLSACEHLRAVSLQGTACGDSALNALAGKAHLCQLRTGNAVTDAGLALLHEFPIFKSWHGGEPSLSLLSYDAGPNYLLLGGRLTDRGMTRLEGLGGLFALNLDGSEHRISAAGLEPLVRLPNLGWLAFDATDDAMHYIARMPRLRFLGCQDTVAGDDGFVALSQSTSIECIWGRRCHNLRTRGFAAMGQMPALRALSVSCKNVMDAGVAELPRFPALRELMPMDVPDEGYCHIARCENLESLILMYCRDTTDTATEHVVRLPRLASYFASYTRITNRTPQMLSGMDSLERITFDGCAGVTNSGLGHLNRLPRLKELRVSGSGITPEVVNTFPSRVRVHYSL
jgi:hypothetical protein